MTESCNLCSSTENIHQHHTNYERDETLPLCVSCHVSIHNDPDHELYPDDPENRYGKGPILNPITKQIVEVFLENPTTCYNMSQISDKSGVCRESVYNRLDALLTYRILEESVFDKYYKLNPDSEIANFFSKVIYHEVDQQ